MRPGHALLLTLALIGASDRAIAKCSVENFGLLKISMQGPRPVTEGEINGMPVRFIVDSGAFFSTLGPAKARELGLSTTPLPQVQLRGIGGNASASLATVNELKIAGVALNKIQFIVGGSDTGFAGVIGQNVLGLRDVEYDFHHGAVRLMAPKDCGNDSLAYWAGDQPVSMLPIEQTDGRNRHTIGTVLLNGVKVRAGFDSGATGTVVTPKAARRAGVKTDDPGVRPAGFALGFGSRQVPAWSATFEAIDIGGEKLRNIQLRIQELPGDIEMLVGIDFFLSHRIYVSNEMRRMFFTYEGGPVFGITPARAITATGETIALKDSGTEPTDAAGYSARGTSAAAKRDFASAITDLNRAVELDPTNGRYLLQRSQVRLALRQQALAAGDLDKAKALAPKDHEILLAHGAMSVARRDPAMARSDAAAADAVLAPEAQGRLALAQLYSVLGDHEKALASYDGWLDHHPNDGIRPVALNGRCWARFILNRDLDKALSDCNSAIRLQPNMAAFLDSRGMVRLRRGEYAEAVADLSAALVTEPNRAMTRWSRGVAHEKLGKSEEARRDRDAALAINARVAEEARRYGL